MIMDYGRTYVDATGSEGRLLLTQKAPRRGALAVSASVYLVAGKINIW